MTGRTVKTLSTELNNKAELAKIGTTLREDLSINLLVMKVRRPADALPIRGVP